MRYLILIVALLAGCSSKDAIGPAPGLDISGDWAGTWTANDGSSGPIVLSLFQNGGQVGGSGDWTQSPCLGLSTVTGTIEELDLNLTMGLPGGTLVFHGGASSTTIGGSFSLSGGGTCAPIAGTFQVARGASPLNVAGEWIGEWGEEPDPNGMLDATFAQIGEDVAGFLLFTDDGNCDLGGEFIGGLDGFTLTGTAGNTEIVATVTEASINGSYSVSSGPCAGQTGPIALARAATGGGTSLTGPSGTTVERRW